MYYQRITSALDLEVEAVNEFYSLVGYPHKANRGDAMILALETTDIVGVVRLCLEEGVQVLRGMQLAPSFQGKGFGKEMLRLLSPLYARRCFCIPYKHLEKFYRKSGFRLAPADEIPRFLSDRLSTYRRQDPTKKYIIMVR